MACAVWNRTAFYTTQFADIVFDGTLKDCSFENCEFTRLTFQAATLTNTFFKAKSLKRIRFIDCKADKITYAFLKNGKADMTSITLLTSTLEILEDEEDLKSALTIMDNDEEMVAFEEYDNKRKQG